MITDKTQLLALFDDAVRRATEMAIQKNEPIIESKKKIHIGTLLVCKNSINLYNILELGTKKILYENIELYDSAVIIAQYQNKGMKSTIDEVLNIDKEYSKHGNDMVHYLHCYKIAKQKNNLDRMLILEDKFQLSEQMAKLVRLRLSKFKVNGN